MLERLHHMPAGTIGFRIDGDVEEEDLSAILVPALQAAIDSGQGLRALYLVEDLDDVEGSGLWDDAKVGFRLVVERRGEWKRSAVVTDLDWLTRAGRFLLWLVPGEARLFPVAELHRAKAWVAG